jgi:hypothetical protein
MLLFCDGFDAYASTADLTKKWQSNGAGITWSPTGGKFGGKSIALGSGASTTLVTQTLTPNQVGGHAGAAFWFIASGKPAGNVSLIAWHGNAGAHYAYWGINPAGYIQWYNYPFTTWENNIGGGPNICDGLWHWIELMSETPIFNTNMHGWIWVDGVQIMNGQTMTGNSGVSLNGAQMVELFNPGGITGTIDDFIFIDDQTAGQTGELIAQSVFPIGPKKCETVWPSGAGTNTNWAPDSGVNYARVNEISSDGDASYVQASVSGTRDSYAFPGTITGNNPLVTVVNCAARNADAGSINIQGLTYNGSSYGLGDSKTAGLNYQMMQFPIYRDPNTSAAWTRAGVNAAQFGVGVV